jgi:hypothetical protein
MFDLDSPPSIWKEPTANEERVISRRQFLLILWNDWMTDVTCRQVSVEKLHGVIPHACVSLPSGLPKHYKTSTRMLPARSPEVVAAIYARRILQMPNTVDTFNLLPSVQCADRLANKVRISATEIVHR